MVFQIGVENVSLLLLSGKRKKKEESWRGFWKTRGRKREKPGSSKRKYFIPLNRASREKEGGFKSQKDFQLLLGSLSRKQGGTEPFSLGEDFLSRERRAKGN